MAELEFVVDVPEQGRVIAFPGRGFTIGSDPDCQVCFKSPSIKPKHAEIAKDNRGQWWVRDLVGGGNVFVNGTPILDERLSEGDSLQVGDVVLSVRNSGVNAHARTRSGDLIPVTPLPPSLPPNALVAGVVIAQRYRILGLIATGGMGEVYRAEHVELGKALALKVMLPELSGSNDFVGRFKREAIASSRIGQQNIVDIFDFGRTDDGRFYFVMEFVEGRTLVGHRRDGAFPVPRVVHVGLQVARALAAAHAVNIIHRDLKPENIMLIQRPGQPDFVKVLDFGIAKVQGGTAATAIGSVVGTPQYMAPEQASAAVVDGRADVYALGLIFHELLSGEPTFTGESHVELMTKQLNEPPPPVSSPLGPVPIELTKLIDQMLEKAPSRRVASMLEVVSRLEAVPSVVTAVAPVLANTSDAKRAQATTEPEARAVTQTDASAKTELMPAVDMRTQRMPQAPVSQFERQAATPLPGVVEEPLPDLRPSRGPWIVVALSLLFILGISGWWWSMRVPQPSAPPPSPAAVPAVATPEPKVAPVKATPPSPPPEPAAIRLEIVTIPEGADVTFNGALVGHTPISLTRPPGTEGELRFEKKGSVSLTRVVRFEADGSLRFELEREAPKAKPKPAAKPPNNGELMDVPY